MTPSKTILLVDDTEEVRSAVAALLGSYGFEVEQAEDGIVALEMLKSQTFKIVVTDIEMPNMNGIELLRRIRAVFPLLPVFVFSGSAEKLRNPDLAEMATGVFLKDFDNIQALLREVTKLSTVEIEQSHK